MLTVGSMFSGIGGFDLGLERAGFTIKWQVEIDPYCSQVLAKHWPHITRYGDITTIDWATVPRVDLLCGGFPCQDLSFAGKRAGINGARSGLWSEYVRAIVQLRPRYVLVENVPGLLSNPYMGRVLGDLAACGYDAEWDCLPAASFKLPHIRDRVWLFAYPASERWNILDDSAPSIFQRECLSNFKQPEYRWKRKAGGHSLESVGWMVEPAIPGSHDGIPTELDKAMIHGLGNAIVPQIVEALGRMIVAVGK